MSLNNNGIKYYIAIVNILFRLPIESECCSLTTDYIVNLIYDKENFLQDPCYIQWKATQDAKLAGPREPNVERALIGLDRWQIQKAIDSRLNLQKSYSQSSFTLPVPALVIKESVMPISLVFTLVVFVVITCCFLTCFFMRNEDNSTTDTATDIPQRDVVMSSESLNVLLQPTSGIANDPLIIGGVPTIAIAHSNFNNGIISSSRQHSRVNVPPIAARKNSLPSYDEAVKMASPPRT